MLTTGARRIKLPYPHPGQRHIRQHRARFTWLAAGRRWRKTTLFASLMIEAAATGIPIVWGAPTYDQVFTAWEEVRRAGRDAIAFNQSRMTATLGRGTMLFRSLDDPEHARSKTAGGVVLDEVADIAEIAWTEVLRPTLMDTNGWLLAGGTPKGRNWFWREWTMAARGERPESVAFQAPSLGAVITPNGLERRPHPLENPDLPWSEIVHLYQTMPERAFRQEILAEFLDDAGGVFRGVRALASVQAPQVPNPDHQYVIGVDWGRSNDYTVFVVVDVTARQVVALERSNQVEYTTQRARLAGLCQTWTPVQVIAESNAMGEPIIEQLRREHVPVQPFTTTNATKAAVIDALVLAIEQQAIALLNHPALIDELEAFEMTRTVSGLPRYSAPDGMHDDCVMALALAWSGVHVASMAPIRRAPATNRWKEY